MIGGRLADNVRSGSGDFRGEWQLLKRSPFGVLSGFVIGDFQGARSGSLEVSKGISQISLDAMDFG